MFIWLVFLQNCKTENLEYLVVIFTNPVSLNIENVWIEFEIQKKLFQPPPSRRYSVGSSLWLLQTPNNLNNPLVSRQLYGLNVLIKRIDTSAFPYALRVCLWETSICQLQSPDVRKSYSVSLYGSQTLKECCIHILYCHRNSSYFTWAILIGLFEFTEEPRFHVY